VLGQSSQLRIGAAAGEDLGVAHSDQPAALTLERLGDDSRAAVSGARLDDLVAKWDQASGLRTSMPVASAARASRMSLVSMAGSHEAQALHKARRRQRLS
jgi:hypothetical protein